MAKNIPAGDAPWAHIKKAKTPVKKPIIAFPYLVLGEDAGSVITKKAANKMPPVKTADSMSPVK